MAKKPKNQNMPAADEAAGASASEGSVQEDTPQAETQTPSAPAWHARIAKKEAKLAQRYEVVPGTPFARRMKKKILTGRDLTRGNLRVERMIKLGWIKPLVESQENES